jgi:hypothetical protein
MSAMIRPVGPVDMVVVGFPTAEFDGSIAPALAEIVRSGTARLLDMVLVSRTLDGELVYLEVEDADKHGIGELTLVVCDTPGLLAEDDVNAVGEGLPPGSSAALIAWENTWAIKAVQAIAANGGFLIAHERISAPDVSAALDAIEA